MRVPARWASRVPRADPRSNAGTRRQDRRCRDAMQYELDDISEKEILSTREKRRIADEMSMSTGVLGALCAAALLSLGLLMLYGSGVLPAPGHSLFATNSHAPLSPRAVIATRFYFDNEAHRQM